MSLLRTTISGMSYVSACSRYQPGQHAEKPHGCLQVGAEDVLDRIRRAKETMLDPQLVLVDVRESRHYHSGHILTARSMSCHTKTMAKRAVACWDAVYTDQHSCPAPADGQQPYFCTEISQVSAPSVVVYDQRGACPYCSNDLAIQYFISALQQRGNLIYFMSGGFDAFKNLRSSDFIDSGASLSESFGFTSSAGCTLTPSKSTHTVTSRSIDLVPLCQGAQKDPSGSRWAPNTSFCAKPLGPLTCAFESKLDEHRPPPTTSDSCRLSWSVHPHHYHSNPISIKLSPELAPQVTSPDDPEDVLNACVSEILPYLFVGNLRDVQDKALLSLLGITHIISVTDCIPASLLNTTEFQCLHLPAVDNHSQDLRPAFENGIQFITEARRNNGTVLVHCQAGVSRSVAVVMAYLMHLWPNFNVIRALEFVQARRPVAGPNLHFLGQLQRFHDDLHVDSAHSPSTVSFSP